MDIEVRDVIHPGGDMADRVPVQKHPFERDVRTVRHRIGQGNDIFVLLNTLGGRVHDAVLVSVEAVMSI
jgi:hypothetical protein